MSTQPYLRYPHIHGDTITFTADDGVWLAGSTGGRAWRLTKERTAVRTPRISPDGSSVAYVSHTDGHPEIFLTEIDTGTVRRLTYWANPLTALLGWGPDGKLLTTTNAGEAHRHQVVRALDTAGGWQRLTYGRVSGMAISASGAVVVSTQNMRPHAHWKRYRGGTAPRLWADPQDSDEWTKLLGEEPAGLVEPMFIGERLLFTSDRAASFPHRSREQANIWIWDDWRSGDAAPRQLTFQTEDEGYVRDAATDGISITWHSRGSIWILDDVDAHPRRLEVSLPGTEPQPVSIDATQNLRAVVPDHGADASLVSWRGKTFWLTHRQGPARAVAADSAVRTRDPVFLGRTGRAALITDADGEDSVEIHTLDGSAAPERLLTGQLGRVLHMAADPTGERLAVISHDGRIRLITLGETPTVREVARSGSGESHSPSFSPDGRYLLWSQPTATQAQLHQLMLLDTAGSQEPVELTSGTFHDFSPAFTRDGQHVVLLSNRTFDPDYDAHEFALSFRSAARPWLIPLSADAPPPFGPTAEGWPLSSTPKEKSSDDAAPTSPDLDPGAEDRITAFPVPSDSYRDLRTVTGGVLWIRESQETGQLGSRRAGVDGEPAGDQLIRWDLAQRTASTIVEDVSSYAVSGDGERLVVRIKDQIIIQPPKKVEDDSPEKVTADLGRLRMQIDPTAEWQQMFSETCRLMAQQYWREDMDGVDWDAVVARWRPVVASVRSHDDLVDLLWEVVGELNTSHAYVIPTPGEEGQQLGMLGADLSPAEGGWKIDRILPTESSDPEARSPLRAAGVAAAEGDLITAVDGHPVDPVFGPARQLVGAAGKPVEITLIRAESLSRTEGSGQAGSLDQAGSLRRVVVVPLADESALRYQDWVRSRRRYVRQQSGGRLGYVHVPDMISSGWAQLHRDLQHAAQAEGLIADVRYNRGGHTSQLVIARLAQRVIAWARPRHEDHSASYPAGAPRGPVVMVANQFSGSDGDIVNAAAQALDVGPVVGERTWGGVIGIDGRFDLVDGTSVTQPKYSSWLGDYGWGVENRGVDPDIEVIHDPGQMFRQDDPQLDRAITEALERLAERPAAAPPELPAPKAR